MCMRDVVDADVRMLVDFSEPWLAVATPTCRWTRPASPSHHHRGALGGVGGHDGFRLPMVLLRLLSGDGEQGLLQRLQLP